MNKHQNVCAQRKNVKRLRKLTLEQRLSYLAPYGQHTELFLSFLFHSFLFPWRHFQLLLAIKEDFPPPPPPFLRPPPSSLAPFSHTSILLWQQLQSTPREKEDGGAGEGAKIFKSLFILSAFHTWSVRPKLRTGGPLGRMGERPNHRSTTVSEEGGQTSQPSQQGRAIVMTLAPGRQGRQTHSLSPSSILLQRVLYS